MNKIILLIIILLFDNPICEKKGHITGEIISSTLLYRPDKIEEYEDSTILIIDDPNKYTARCLRCGETFSFYKSPERIILWKK